MSVGRCLVFLDVAYWPPVGAVEAVFFASSRHLAPYCCQFALCLLRQFSHLIWPGMAGLRQLRHWPAAFLSRRTFCAWRRAASFCSGFCFLIRSYARRASRCSSVVLVGTLGLRTLGFPGLGFPDLLGFFIGFGFG